MKGKIDAQHQVANTKPQVGPKARHNGIQVSAGIRSGTTRVHKAGDAATQRKDKSTDSTRNTRPGRQSRAAQTVRGKAEAELASFPLVGRKFLMRKFVASKMPELHMVKVTRLTVLGDGTEIVSFRPAKLFARNRQLEMQNFLRETEKVV
jgi:hypothetical protein